MRRLTAILGLLALLGFAALATGAADDEKAGKTFKVELDNAFGLIAGADVKIAGVRAGKIKELELDEADMRALVHVEITKTGFGDVRTDAFCESRPQSLIGEYFLDCLPGKSPAKLADGATIPVTQTATTVPPDLVQNIMRRPYRERLSIIYNELGAGLAARGDDLNETIRRASPALREVNKVLAILRDQRTTIRDLYADAHRVFRELTAHRKGVTRFVREARDTAAVSAARTQYVRRNFQRLPRFLHDLQPTMKLLGESAEAQEGALRNLDDNRVLLKRFIDELGPFAENSRPAFRTLGEAAVEGTKAARAGAPRVKELKAAAKPLPEAANNIAISLEHLDDPKFATEKDSRAGRPGGGYTGLEALLRYIFFQSQATNLFDGNTYILKVAAFLDNTCAPYADADRAKNTVYEKCRAWLGPNQPGITTPDPSAAPRTAAQRKRDEREAPAQTVPQPTTAAPKAPVVTKPKVTKPKLPANLPPEVRELLDDLIGDGVGGIGGLGGLLDGGPGSSSNNTQARLLDFLLAP